MDTVVILSIVMLSGLTGIAIGAVFSMVLTRRPTA